MRILLHNDISLREDVRTNAYSPLNKYTPDYIMIGISKKHLQKNSLFDLLQDYAARQTMEAQYVIHEDHGEEYYLIDLVPNRNIQNNKTAFNKFLIEKINDNDFAGKYAAFINGQLQGVDSSRSKLVEKMFEKFGNVEMHVGRLAIQNRKIVETPEKIEI